MRPHIIYLCGASRFMVHMPPRLVQSSFITCAHPSSILILRFIPEGTRQSRLQHAAPLLDIFGLLQCMWAESAQ